MNLLNKINPLLFLISLSIGLFIVYVFGPTPKIIFKYPDPKNSNDLVYEDDANNCYKYSSKEVDCNTNKIASIPLQQS